MISGGVAGDSITVAVEVRGGVSVRTRDVLVPKQQKDPRKPNDIPEEERDYYLERRYPAFGNLVPRDVASRAAKERCDAGFGVGSNRAFGLSRLSRCH